MRSQEMRAHREDLQTRNQLLVMQMQQQAQQQQQLFTAFMQVAAGMLEHSPRLQSLCQILVPLGLLCHAQQVNG